jgi:hypothetical protein
LAGPVWHADIPRSRAFRSVLEVFVSFFHTSPWGSSSVRCGRGREHPLVRVCEVVQKEKGIPWGYRMRELPIHAAVSRPRRKAC